MKEKLLFLVPFILFNLGVNAQFNQNSDAVTTPNLPLNWPSVVVASTTQAKVETDNVVIPPNGSNSSIFQHDFAIDDFKVESGNTCSGINYTWDGTSWSPIGTPTINDTITINGFYSTTIHGNIDACSLLVNAGILLEVKANDYINIANDIVNNGVINVFVTGSVVQVNDNATVTGTGTFNTQISTTTLLDQTRITFFSSPAATEDLTTFTPWANMGLIFDFVGNTQAWNVTNGMENMELGKGYAVRGSSTQTYPMTALTQFVGPFNNGVINQTVYHNVGVSIPGFEDDYNLIGNPYPSAIDADMLLTQNPNLEAFYIWTHATAADANDQFTTTDYAIWTLGGGTLGLSGKIASGQGFFAETNDNNPDFPITGNIEFNNSMRVTTGNNDFRNTSSYQKIWINLRDDSNHTFKQLLVSFMPEGTNNYDLQYDAKSNHTANQFAFYSLDNEHNRLIINTVSELTNNERIIPLGISLEENTNTNLTLSIDHHQNLEDVSIYLLDKVLNITYDLKVGDFNFNPNNETLIEDRYEIVFNRNALSNDSLTLEDSLIITNYDENKIKVVMKDGNVITKLEVYDTLGKYLIAVNPNSSNFIVGKNLKQGQILFIKVHLENGQTLFKKFIKF